MKAKIFADFQTCISVSLTYYTNPRNIKTCVFIFLCTNKRMTNSELSFSF